MPDPAADRPATPAEDPGDDVAPLEAGGTVMNLSELDATAALPAASGEIPVAAAASRGDGDDDGPSIDDFQITGETDGDAPPAAQPQAGESAEELKERLRRELREELLAEMRASAPPAAAADPSTDDFSLLEDAEPEDDDFELAGGAAVAEEAGAEEDDFELEGRTLLSAAPPPPAPSKPKPSPSKPRPAAAPSEPARAEAPAEPPKAKPKPPKLEEPESVEPAPEPEPPPAPEPPAAPPEPPPRPAYTPPAASTYRPPTSKASARSGGGGGSSRPSVEVPEQLKDPKVWAGLVVAAAVGWWFFFYDGGFSTGVEWVRQIAVLHDEFETAADNGGDLSAVLAKQEALQKEIKANLDGAKMGGARRSADLLAVGLGELIRKRQAGGPPEALARREEQFAELIEVYKTKLGIEVP